MRTIVRLAVCLLAIATVVVSTVGAVASTPSTTWWRPIKGITWQWQLSGAVNTAVHVSVFDIDGQANSAKTVSILHAKRAHVICYVEVGGWENYRPDAKAFPASVLGKVIDGWPDERWLDIRQLSVLLPVMSKRFAQCKAKHFDAIEPDVLDGYANDTGFPLTAQDQLTYNTAIAALAHKYGLAVGLKNDPDQATTLAPKFDFAVVEQCYQYSECSAFSPFTAANKPVFEVEYQGSTATFCPTMKRLGFSSLRKRLALDAWRQPCP
jgi:hypothetical protein